MCNRYFRRLRRSERIVPPDRGGEDHVRQAHLMAAARRHRGRRLRRARGSEGACRSAGRRRGLSHPTEVEKIMSDKRISWLPHVVIVGAGFGGLAAAKALAEAPVD